VRILDFAIRLGAALLMGAVVGLERQWRQRMAGTLLVAAGTRIEHEWLESERVRAPMNTLAAT
jgi:hypothetical protein